MHKQDNPEEKLRKSIAGKVKILDGSREGIEVQAAMDNLAGLGPTAVPLMLEEYDKLPTHSHRFGWVRLAEVLGRLGSDEVVDHGLKLLGQGDDFHNEPVVKGMQLLNHVLKSCSPDRFRQVYGRLEEEAGMNESGDIHSHLHMILMGANRMRGDMDREIDRCIEQLEAPESSDREDAITTITIHGSELLDELKVSETEGLMVKVTPPLLRIIHDRQGVKHAFDYAGVMNCFKEWGEHADRIQDLGDPKNELRLQAVDAIVDPINAAGDGDESLFEPAIRVLALNLAEEMQELPKTLVRKIQGEGDVGLVAHNALFNINPKRIVDCIRTAHKSEFAILTASLADGGERNWDAAFAYASEEEPESKVRGLAVLSGFAVRIAHGSREPEIQSELALIEGKMRGDDMKKLLDAAKDSDTNELREQATLINSLMRII